MNFKIEIEGFPVVCYNQYPFYFKKGWSVLKAESYFKDLLMEQDEFSPHRYCTNEFFVENEDIVLDIGVAEGSFSIENLRKGKHFYLFEHSIEWFECLKKTFDGFQNVTLVNKFVGDYSDEKRIKLDDIEVLRNSRLFIKIDVDGSEREVLEGMSEVLTINNQIKLVICTYHNQGDFDEFNELLQKYGFKTEHSDGYMLFYHDLNFDSPYLRRGVIRAWK